MTALSRCPMTRASTADARVQAATPPLPADMLAQGQRLTFDKDDVLLPLGSLVPGLYYIAEGKVRIVRLSDEAERRISFYINAGHFVYETRFLAQLPLTIQAEAVCPTTVIFFDKSTTMRLMRTHEEFIAQIFTSIADKMNALGLELVESAYTQSAQRILHTLRDLAQQEGSTTVSIRQEELAELLGLHRVTVNRALRNLEGLGKISVSRQRIFLNE